MEQIDPILTVIGIQIPLFCLFVFIATFAVRRIVETAWAGVKTNKWWTEVFLPLGPIATGVILAFAAKTYAWPDVVKDPWSRAFVGAACGMASGWVYTRFRSILKAWSTGPRPSQSAPTPSDVTPVTPSSDNQPPSV